MVVVHPANPARPSLALNAKAMSEQLLIDPLVPYGREKFRLHEVGVIIGLEGRPLAVRTVREAMESGQLGGYRMALSAKPGEEQRIKHEFVTAADLNLYLLRSRTLARTEHLTRMLRLIDGLNPTELDQILRHTTARRAAAPKR